MVQEISGTPRIMVYAAPSMHTAISNNKTNRRFRCMHSNRSTDEVGCNIYETLVGFTTKTK